MTDSTTSIATMEAAANFLAQLAGPNAPRALLVTMGSNAQLQSQPIVMGQSIVNIRTELQDHLDAYPFPTEWLENLRDYLDGRLAARSEAARTGGCVIPRGPGRWEIAHAAAFQSLTVGGSA